MSMMSSGATTHASASFEPALQPAAGEVSTQADAVRDAILRAVEGALAGAQEQLQAAERAGDAAEVARALAKVQATRAELAAIRDRQEEPATQPAQAEPPAPVAPPAPGEGRFTFDGREFTLEQSPEGITLRSADGTDAMTINPQEMIPPEVPYIIGTSFAGIALVIMAFPIGRAIARWIDRRGTAPRVPDEVAQRLTRIEQAVDTVAVEMERIAEGQRFTAKVLSGGTPDFAPRAGAGNARDAVPARGGTSG